MKRLIIFFAVVLIALPSSAQRRVSKRSSDNDRKEAHRQVSRTKDDRHTSSRTVEKRSSVKRDNIHISRDRKNNRSSVNKSRGQRSVVKRSGQASRGYKRNNSERQDGHDRAVNSYRNRSSSNKATARNSYYDRRHNRRSYGKSHGHINRFYTGRKIARNHYHVYNRPHHSVVFRHSWFSFYVNYFPSYRIHYNRHIDVISGDIAKYHIGDLKVVYGRVYETYYDPQVNEFYLYFGYPYPRQDLTVVVTGRDARRLARKSARYFIGRDFSVAGLITSWEGNPEIVINDEDQLRRF